MRRKLKNVEHSRIWGPQQHATMSRYKIPRFSDRKRVVGTPSALFVAIALDYFDRNVFEQAREARVAAFDAQCCL